MARHVNTLMCSHIYFTTSQHRPPESDAGLLRAFSWRLDMFSLGSVMIYRRRTQKNLWFGLSDITHKQKLIKTQASVTFSLMHLSVSVTVPALLDAEERLVCWPAIPKWKMWASRRTSGEINIHKYCVWVPTGQPWMLDPSFSLFLVILSFTLASLLPFFSPLLFLFIVSSCIPLSSFILSWLFLSFTYMVLCIAVKAHKHHITVPLRQRELLSLFVRKKVWKFV